MRSWRIRGIGSSSAAVPDNRPAVPDQRAQPTAPTPTDQGGRHAAPTPDQPVASTGGDRGPGRSRSIGRFTTEPPGGRSPADVSAGQRSNAVSIAQRSRPASPFADAVRGVPPCPLRVRSAPTCGDLDHVLSEVREIAVWAGNDGRVQDTGRFLLLDREGVWHAVRLGGAQGAELIARMRTTLGFDTNLLLDAISCRSGQIEPLWPPRAVAGARR